MHENTGRILTLLAGVALGALASGLLFQALERPAVSTLAAEPRIPESPAAPSHTLPQWRANESHEPSAIRAVETGTAAEENSARSRAPLATAADAAGLSELLATLNAAYARGEVTDEDLVQLLFSVMLSHGNAEAALDLITRFNPQDVGALVQVAVALSQQGRTERAREILERALAISPDDDWVLNQYAGVDSNGALPYFLARLGQQPPPGDPGLRLQIAQLYANSGRLAEARAAVETLLRQNPGDSSALQILAGIDPAAAERYVRELIATGDATDEWSAVLMQMVLQQGRTDEAAALLESRRAQGTLPEPGDFGAIAQTYLEQGKTQDAIRMWANAFDIEQGDPDNWTAALQEYAPQQLLTMLEARTAQGANDEFWGALGDSYWRANRRAEATNAWREASRLDPEDGEWTTKLTQVAAGQDPL